MSSFFGYSLVGFVLLVFVSVFEEREINLGSRHEGGKELGEAEVKKENFKIVKKKWNKKLTYVWFYFKIRLFLN